jgi:iron(III) transport system ATP-binding protein
VTSLTIDGLSKSFGSFPVLRDVDLEVRDGSLTAILGPSGSGKTTLLRIVAGFERSDRGTVRIGDLVVDDGSRYLPPERRRIGYVPQEGALFPHLTVLANIAFGLPRKERRGADVRDLVAMVGLAGLEHRYPHQLSGGQQQRVALARALTV